MKLIYSQLQKILPALQNIPAKQVAQKLTYLGHFNDGLETINNQQVISLEVRQNRGETLGYYGLAKDLEVLYGPIVFDQKPTIYPRLSKPTPISIQSDSVYRIQSLVVSNLKNSPSPSWLKQFLSLHQINSINTLVDLTNYIMLIYGVPCHAFDTQKIGTPLTWQNNSGQYKQFTTLDGTSLNLEKNMIVVTSQNRVDSLSFIGGKQSAIDLSTTNTLLEMAVYDRSQVKADSRRLKTVTEAGIRLDKELDTELIPKAFNHLVSLVLKHCGGQITTSLFDHYPQKPNTPTITFNPRKVSQIAGVEISSDFSLDILKKLGCLVSPLSKGDKEGFFVNPPSYRKDLSIEEDLIEEVVRFYGYNNIPSNQPINFKKVNDITPKIISLVENLKDTLVNLGYDEIRSWPLVSKPTDVDTAISTQNNINSKYPYLRQSMIQSLKSQLRSYNRYKVPNPQFFEISKVFFKKNNKYIESYSLGIYHHNLSWLQKDILTMGLKPTSQDNNFVEVILDTLNPTNLHLDTQVKPQTHQSTIELTNQIVTLDANLITKVKTDPQKLINKYQQILKDNLWQIEITDIYQNPHDKSYKYTFRVSYFNLTDKLAKKIHLTTFNLL